MVVLIVLVTFDVTLNIMREKACVNLTKKLEEGGCMAVLKPTFNLTPNPTPITNLSEVLADER
jgi:hypothetical protein